MKNLSLRPTAISVPLGVLKGLFTNVVSKLIPIKDGSLRLI